MKNIKKIMMLAILIGVIGALVLSQYVGRKTSMYALNQIAKNDEQSLDGYQDATKEKSSEIDNNVEVQAYPHRCNGCEM